MCVASVVLPTPPFWLSKATIMARPSSLEEQTVFAVPNGVVFGVFAGWFFGLRQLSTAMLFLYQ